MVRAPPPGRGEDPRIVFLTPGSANETYYEHAYLARYLGYPLVEGADLTTRDRQVYLRTVGGLKKVSAIVRSVVSAAPWGSTTLLINTFVPIKLS